MQLDNSIYEMLYKIIDLAGLLLDAGLIVFLVNNYLLPRFAAMKKPAIRALGFCCECAFIYIIGFSNEFYFFVLSIFGGIMLYAVPFFKGEFYRKLSICCIYCSLYFIMDGIYLNLYMFLGENFFTLPNSASLALVFFQRIVCKGLMYFIIRLVLKNVSVIDDMLPSAYKACLMVFCGFDILLMLLNIFYLNPSKNVVQATPFLSLFMLGCFCMILCFIYLFTAMVRNHKENLSLRLQTKEWELHGQYLQQAKRLIDDSRKFRHDMKSHLFCMEGLLEQEKYDELKDYLSQFRDSEFLRLPLQSYCADDRLNTLLNQKKQQALELSIPMDIQVRISNQYAVQKMDLCTILSNLCDNAVEASKKTEQPHIYVEIKEIKGYLSITVQNHTEKDVLAENPELITTKDDQQFHGLGLSIIRNIADKYHGSVDITSEENTFTCFVLLENVRL